MTDQYVAKWWKNEKFVNRLANLVLVYNYSFLLSCEGAKLCIMNSIYPAFIYKYFIVYVEAKYH